ncbi:MAG TPA: FKBP-type peptidyl-prolyl cis-trans isomerase [Candidatus Saccharimonadales bacterium]|jgi:peptidylprolyl isomerase
MARMRDRVFAGFGAFLFLGSACALTIFVVLQPGADSASNTTNSQSSQQTCQDTNTEPTLPVPDAYKPTEPVTSLQSTDLSTGTGPAAKSGDCLVVKYYGTLASNGTKFDEDFTDATGLAFTLGQGQVIPGWDQGLIGMKAGGMRRLAIPASLAYGSQSPTAAIPANSDLVFVVKLLRIQN